MAIGVFGLQVAYKLKRLEVMSIDDTHGWFGGGSYGSTVDRIDFSNDTGTANIRGSLSLARSSLAATGNSNYGWFGGGYVIVPSPFSFTYYSRVDRIDFSNDSSTASVRGPLSTERSQLAATGNSNYGWFGGGSGAVSTVDRIDFSNDAATASPRGPLSLARSGLQSSSTGNSNYGWFGGGLFQGPGPSVVVSTVDRIDFSNDSPTASLRGPLSLAKRFVSATGNSNYGWFGGGYVPGSPGTLYSTVDRIDFSNDSPTASLRGPLSQVKYVMGATGNSNYGWFGGGLVPGPTTVSRVDRIDFSNDSVSVSPRGPLSSVRSSLVATSGQAKGPAIKLQKGGNFGWFGGGFSGGFRSTVDRIDFSNDSATASPRGPLSLGRTQLTSTGNSNYGWFGGGETGAPTSVVTTVDRIDFSNDSGTASVRGPLSLARRNLAATGNSNYGWFGGGNAPIVSTVDRIDFSNDSGTSSLRGSLSATRYQLAATGNSNYGWFGGGRPQVSTVDRINFSNDSVIASVRSPLSLARYSLAATGNSNYGWFGGGSPGPVATVDRIDFSNDSSTASVRGSLSAARENLSATGNSNYGWFGGGYSTTAIVNRINFSNDLSTTSVRGPLSSARYGLAATSNTPT